MNHPVSTQKNLVSFLYSWENILFSSIPYLHFMGFPCGSADKEFTCNAEDLGSIPGLGEPLEEGSILAWRIPGMVGCHLWGHTELDTTEVT